MFVVMLKYVKPLEEVDKHLPAHLAYLDRQYALEHFIVSGRKVPRTGGVIVASVPDRATLDAILAEDPFAQNGVAQYEVTEFEPVRWDARFSPFLP